MKQAVSLEVGVQPMILNDAQIITEKQQECSDFKGRNCAKLKIMMKQVSN